MNSNCTTESTDTDYIKQLEETVEVLTSNINRGTLAGYWYDRRAGNDVSNPINRSDLKVMDCVSHI